jgi:exonuclease III
VGFSVAGITDILESGAPSSWSERTPQVVVVNRTALDAAHIPIPSEAKDRCDTGQEATGTMLRLGTFNVRSGRNGNLESCLRGLDLLLLDVVVLTETKLHDDKFTKMSSGYEIFATHARSTSQGGVALAIRKERGKRWDAEQLQRHGPNVIAFTLVSGKRRTRIIGIYLPPGEADESSLNSTGQAIEEAKDPVVVMGDFNADLGGHSRNLRFGSGGGTVAEQRELTILATVAGHGLVDSGKSHLQKSTIGTWTWQQWRNGDRVRASIDFILTAPHVTVRRHRVRRVQFASTDHRAVYIDLPLATLGAHRRYAFSNRTWPIKVLLPEEETKADKLFQICLASKKPPELQPAVIGRPSWILVGTWDKIRLKADLHSERPWAAKRLRTRRLKKEIQTGLKADRERRLDQAAVEIEKEMATDIPAGIGFYRSGTSDERDKGLRCRHPSFARWKRNTPHSTRNRRRNTAK